jgi:hypothetical protein
MSTRINVTVGDGGLLDRNAQQTAANRQAKVLADQRAAAEAEGVERRAADRTAAGLDPLTGFPASTPSSASTINRLDQEPAANRREELSVGAYQFRLNVDISISSFTKSDSASFELATADGSAQIVEDYGGETTTLPNYNPDVAPPPGTVPSPVRDSLGPPDNVTYTISNEGDAFNNAVDRSEVYTIPAGKNSAYVVVYLNYGYANVRSRATGNFSVTWDTWDTQVVTGQVSFEGGASFNNISWSGNTGVISNQTPVGEPLTLWSRSTSNTTGTFTREVINVFTRYRNECHVYYVTEKTVIKITRDVNTIYEKIKRVNPPVESVPAEINYVPSNNVSYNWSGNYSTELTSAETRFGPIGFPQVSTQSAFTTLTTIRAGAAPVKLPLDKNLAYYLGGLYMLDPQGQQFPYKAWGPSFAIILLQDPPSDFNFEQDDPRSRSYDYMESTYLRAKPRYYVSPCVRSQQGETAGPVCSDTEAVWQRTGKRPSTTSEYLVESDFRPFPKNSISTLQAPQNALGFFTNWGRSTYCKRLASQLGLVPPSP